MKSIKYILCFFAAMCLLSATGLAQDKIVRRNGVIIECKVLKIGSEVITYKLADSDITVEFEIEKSKVEKIIFENGAEHVIDHAEIARESMESNSADLFLVQNQNAIKWNFTSTFMGTTEIGYEKALKPGQAFEVDLAIIGLGFNIMSEFSDEKNPFGIGFKAGYKFLRSPDFYMRKMRYSHILKGSYVKPEIAFASYGGGHVDQNVTKGAFLITFGKQTVYSNKFLVDFYYSVGFGFTSGDIENSSYYFTVLGDGFPLSTSGGMRLGILF